jgi:hypothetical protein
LFVEGLLIAISATGARLTRKVRDMTLNNLIGAPHPMSSQYL